MRHVLECLFVAVMGLGVVGGCDPLFEGGPSENTVDFGSGSLGMSWTTLTEFTVSEPGTLHGSVSFNSLTEVECAFEHVASGRIVGASHSFGLPSASAVVTAEDVTQGETWRFIARIYTLSAPSDSDEELDGIWYDVTFDPESKSEEGDG